MDKRAVGLYAKYQAIERTDGQSAPGGKHHGCDYFVLDLTHDPHARPALLAYADSCEAEYPLLARDLRAKFPTVPAPPAGAGDCADCEHPREYHNASGCGIEQCGCQKFARGGR